MAAWGEVVLFAVPFSAIDDVVRDAGEALVGKTVIDAAFNTIFAQHMDFGQLDGNLLTAFVASGDVDAKQTVMELAQGIGFDAVDAGSLKNARLLEPLASLNIQLGHVLGMGTQIGFKLLHD